MITNDVTLLLGSNMGNRMEAFAHAEGEMEKVVGNVIMRSKVYETAAWGNEDIAPFLNRVIDVQTMLSPQEILQKILKIEESMGRSRAAKWESRIIDIDILFLGDQIIRLPDLIIPHPFLHQRRFTLVPLVEIHATKVHPAFLKTCKQLLAETTDLLPVADYIEPFATK